MSVSIRHEVLVDVFRERPDLAITLLAPLIGAEFPAGTSRVVEAAFTQIAPAEYMADLVLGIGAPDEPPALGIVLEVQLDVDEGKRYSWPVYGTTQRARWRQPAIVAVVAPSTRVAAWAGRPIPLGPGAGYFQPHVIGPDQIPHVTDVGEACAGPELAVLSALAHGGSADGRQVLEALAHVVLGLPENVGALYYEVVAKEFPEAMRRAMEVVMPRRLRSEDVYSEFGRKYFGEGLEQGLEQGHVNGRRDEALRLVLRQLGRRCGLPGEALQARLAALDLESLESLGEALLDFTGIAELEAWLDVRERP